MILVIKELGMNSGSMEEENKIKNRQFEEYKLLRDTISHFDRILVSLRRNTIYFAFTIFAAAITATGLGKSDKVLYEFTGIDLSIVLIIIGLLVVVSFFFLENHYRYYLLKIVEIAERSEEILDLGVRITCEQNPKCERASISKCLKCMHDNGMEMLIRTAHFNLYALLLGIGFVILNMLLFIKINLSYKEFLIYSITTLSIAFGSFWLYINLNIKNQKEKCVFNSKAHHYIISIFLFIILTYIFYKFIFETNTNTIPNFSFAISYFAALFISFIIFCMLIFKNK